jgi:hypothetical protein
VRPTPLNDKIKRLGLRPQPFGPRGVERF